MRDVTTFADGLWLPECPRWHDSSLWSSDMWGGVVYRYDEDGTKREVLRLEDDEPGGIGWLPDGTLLVVGMISRLVYRFDGQGLAVHADLTEVAPFGCNDMIVRADGTAYVSHFGFDFHGGSTGAQPATLIRVRPDGSVDTVAGDLMVPNGMTVTDDGSTLVVAEPGASRLTRFRLAADGSVTDRDTFATIEPLPGGPPYAPPDGICADAEGAVWMAEPIGKRVLRVEDGGRVLEELPFELEPLAVALGGPDRKTLYVCLVPHHDRTAPRDAPRSRIDALRVDVPGAGRP